MRLLQRMFGWFRERKERFSDHLVDEPEYAQRAWVTLPLPLASDRGGLEDELRHIRHVRNPIEPLEARKNRIFEMLTRLDVEAEPRNGVWLAGPKSASHSRT